MAVVSQPFDRSATCPAPGDPQDELNEFWEENPWQIAFKHNLSGFERNRTYLNMGGKRFADISHLTSADSDGDGRSVVADDFNGDGRMDLLVRQAGGPPLLLFENQFLQRHWLKVALRGTSSNRLGIGARLTAKAGNLELTRELFPGNSFYSQESSTVHFGIGDNETIDSLEVRWPNGKTQTFKALPADRFILIDEMQGEIQTVQRGQTEAMPL